MRHPALDFAKLPPPRLWRQANCWIAGVKEWEAHDNRMLIIVKSQRAITSDAWWVRLTAPFGKALVLGCWVQFAIGWLAQGKKFGHVWVGCTDQGPSCWMHYSPPRWSRAARFPPAKFKGRWIGMKETCKCIRDKLEHGNDN